jgi:hypothetical protein
MEEKQKVRLVKTITTALAILAIIIVVSGYQSRCTFSQKNDMILPAPVKAP